MKPKEFLEPGVEYENLKISWRNIIVNISYVFMLIAWLFDFNSDSAGRGLLFQFWFMILYVFSFFVFILNARYSKLLSVSMYVYFPILFVFVGVVTGIFLGQDVYGIFRNTLNLFVYVSSLFSTFLIVRMSRNNLLNIRYFISAFCTLYMVSNLFIVYFFQGGVDFRTVRYEIIGTSAVFGIGYAALFFRFKLNIFEILAALVTVFVIFLSVTRTWLLVFIAQFCLLLIFGKGLSMFAVRRAFLPVTLFVIMAAVLQVVGVPAADRWTARLSASDRLGVDPTALSRERQISSMIDSFYNRPLFGNGFYGESHYWLERDLGGDDSVNYAQGFGHHQDVSLIFIAGIFGAGPLVVLLYFTGVRSIFFIYRLRDFDSRNDAAALGMLCCLVLVGYLVFGQFGATFGSRGMTLWYGMATGLMLGLHSLLRPSGTHNVYQCE